MQTDDTLELSTYEFSRREEAAVEAAFKAKPEMLTTTNPLTFNEASPPSTADSAPYIQTKGQAARLRAVDRR